jgi:hypothetical protein
LLTLVSFSKITKEAQILLLLFSTVKVSIGFHKKGLGLSLGDFFTNTSGHPGSKAFLHKYTQICLFGLQIHHLATLEPILRLRVTTPAL